MIIIQLFVESAPSSEVRPSAVRSSEVRPSAVRSSEVRPSAVQMDVEGKRCAPYVEEHSV